MKPSFLVFITMLFFSVQGILAQNTSDAKTIDKQEAKLIESSPYQTSEIASLHIDMLRNEMQRSSNSKGLIAIYCGKNCQRGEIEAHLLGINIALLGKGVKVKDFIVLQSGFRDKFTVEYWLIPENACLPMPDSTVNTKDVKFKGIYKRKIVYYDCC